MPLMIAKLLSLVESSISDELVYVNTEWIEFADLHCCFLMVSGLQALYESQSRDDFCCCWLHAVGCGTL